MTNINQNFFMDFISSKVGTSINKYEAQKLGLEKEFQAKSDEIDSNEIELTDLNINDELYAKFATMYVAEIESDNKAKDKEEEKEEQIAVSGKDGTATA